MNFLFIVFLVFISYLHNLMCKLIQLMKGATRICILMVKIIRLIFLACFSQCILRTFSLDSLIFTIDLLTFYHDCRSLIRFAAYYLSSRRLRVLLQRMVVNIVALLLYTFDLSLKRTWIKILKNT